MVFHPRLPGRNWKVEMMPVCGGRKIGKPGERPSEQGWEPTKSTHNTSTPGFELRPHWWEASVLTTAPSCSPKVHSFKILMLQRDTTIQWNLVKGRFTRYNFVACDMLTTSLRQESFRVNQTYNLLAIVVCDTKNVVGF